MVGHAQSAGAELYSSVVARFQGFNWTAVVRQPNQIALQTVAGLKTIQSDIATSQQQVIYILGASVVFVLIIAILLAGSLSRAIINPLNELRDLAEAVSKGNTARGIEVHADDEIKDVAVAFERMRTSVAIMVKRIRGS
ncbi:MAG: methyl-accepting chemotaxis protein [Parasphingorhabdus sp.]